MLHFWRSFIKNSEALDTLACMAGGLKYRLLGLAV